MFVKGQEVYIGFVESEGEIISFSSAKGEYLVKLSSGVYSYYPENEITPLCYVILDKATGENILDQTYNTRQAAIDDEEDLGYDMLEIEQEPPAMEVWLVNQLGDKLRKVELV